MKSFAFVSIIACTACSVEVGPHTPDDEQASFQAEVNVRADVEAEVGAGDDTDGGARSSCHGNDDVVVENATIESPTVGVSSHGNCRLTVRNSTIVASVGVASHGNSRVVLENTTVTGSQKAIELHGNSRVVAKGSSFKGSIEAHGNAGLDDDGSNTFEP